MHMLQSLSFIDGQFQIWFNVEPGGKLKNTKKGEETKKTFMPWFSNKGLLMEHCEFWYLEMSDSNTPL